MAHSFSRNHIHLVFSTKDRRNVIPIDWRPRLWAYLAGICKNHEMIPLAVGGTENHVHMLIHLPPKLALAKAVALLKANSSKWMGEQGKDFSWQDGRGLYLEPAGIKDTQHLASARQTSIRSLNTSRTRNHTTRRRVLKTNFAHCFENTAWNMTSITFLARRVSRLRGSGFWREC